MSPILLFIATAYVLSIALSLVVGVTGGYVSPLIGLRYLSMFLPAVAALVVAKQKPPHINLRLVPLRYLFIALFLIPVVVHAVALPVFSAINGRIEWQEWLTPQADGLYHTPASRGWGTITLAGLIVRFVLNGAVGLIVATFLSFFEEIGWRAWLLPRLRKRMSPVRAVVITSIIWALWHVPFQLSGIQHIEGVSPVKLALTLPIGIMVTGFIFGWLWLRTESVLLCAIAHGSLNAWSQYAFKFMKDPATTSADTIALSAAFVVLLVVAAFLLWRDSVS